MRTLTVVIDGIVVPQSGKFKERVYPGRANRIRTGQLVRVLRC